MSAAFFALLEIKRAKQALARVLDRITPDTEYLRDEVTEQLRLLHVLLGKMEREKVLQQDRDAVLSAFLQPPDQGLGEWLTDR